MQVVLLTRSNEENAKLHKELTLLGFTTISSSLLYFTELKIDKKILEPFQNIIITSKQAAKIVSNNSKLFTEKKFWMVGESSAELLKTKGLEVEYIAANVAELISNLPKVNQETFLYLSSDKISRNLPSPIKRYIIYKTTYSKKLHKEIIRQIKLTPPQFILVYSKNCAKTLVKLLIEDSLLKMLESSYVISISLSVTEILKPYFNNVVTSKEAKKSKMTELLIEYAKTQRNTNQN